jgi:hypothetical protein
MSLWGKVSKQTVINHATVQQGNWIEFAPGQTGYARRLAAEGKIELVDYSVVMPEGMTITLCGGDEYETWCKRLNITRSPVKPYAITTDVGVLITGKNPYIVKNIAAFAAIVANLNYTMFAAIESYTMNMNQYSFKGKADVSKFVPDMRLPVYSADWIIWRNDKTAFATLERMEAIRTEYGVPLNIALTISLYLNKPFFYPYASEWI